MKKLTRAEEEIMHIIWALEKCTVGDIRNYMVEKLQQKKPPHSTVSTLVRILDEKGFLEHEAFGRTFVYRPLISKEDYSDQSLQTLVRDYFEGSTNRLVSFLVKREDLSLDDLNNLIQKLEKSEEE